MGRSPCCSKVGLNRGPWSPEEDACLAKYVETHGEGCWRAVPKSAGLLRCGKSCRLRWVNYLRPSVRRGNISEDEENLIIKLHSLLGNRWSLIAGRIPGRTDNEIKNYWNTHLSKKLKKMGFDPKTHKSVNMSQTKHCQARADRSNENCPGPSFQSRGTLVSESLEETYKHQTDSVRFSLTCNQSVQHSRLLTRKESCSVEINSSNTYKIHSSEILICRPTSPTNIDHTVCHKIMDQDLSTSVISEHQGEDVHLRPVSAVVSTTGDSFTSNCSSPLSVPNPADFSSNSISNCDSLSSLLTTTSTTCSKDQLIISSEPTSAPTIEYDKERALDQTSFLQAFDFLPTDFSDYDTIVSSPASSGIFPQHITNNNVMKNDTKLSFYMGRHNTSMDLADVDQINFLEEPAYSVGDLISGSINKQEATEYSDLTMPSTRTDLWDGFGQITSSDDDDKPPLNSLNVESCIFSFHYNCDLEVEFSRQPTILPQHRDEYDDNWYFESSCSAFHGDNSVYSYELY